MPQRWPKPSLPGPDPLAEAREPGSHLKMANARMLPVLGTFFPQPSQMDWELAQGRGQPSQLPSLEPGVPVTALLRLLGKSHLSTSPGSPMLVG